MNLILKIIFLASLLFLVGCSRGDNAINAESSDDAFCDSSGKCGMDSDSLNKEGVQADTDILEDSPPLS